MSCFFVLPATAHIKIFKPVEDIQCTNHDILLTSHKKYAAYTRKLLWNMREWLGCSVGVGTV